MTTTFNNLPGNVQDSDQAVDNLSAALRAVGAHPSQTYPAPLRENGSSYIHFRYQKRITQPEPPDVPVVALNYTRHFPAELNPVLDQTGDDAGGQRKTAKFQERFRKSLSSLL